MFVSLFAQVIANFKHYENQKHFLDDCKHIRRGDIIGIIGTPMRSQAGELSVKAEDLVLLTPSLRMLPDTWFGVSNKETKYRQRYLDLLINKDTQNIFITRSKIIAFLRRFLENLGFIEVETPILISQEIEASALPFKTYHKALNLDLFLRISPELYLKKLVVGGMNRVFEIGRQFRNEGIDRDHNPEFTMCEFYMAYADYFDLINLTESLLSEMVFDLFGSYSIEYSIKDSLYKLNFKPPFRRIKFMEALESAVGVSLPAPELLHTKESKLILLDLCHKHKVKVLPSYTNANILDKMCSHFVEPLCTQPTFLIDHPQEMSHMAKHHRSVPGLTERFELFIAKKELCNAYTELNDPIEQRLRFERMHTNNMNSGISEFCTALEYGLPPTAGWGMGIDRLVMLLTNSPQIKDVLLFPILKPKRKDDSSEVNTTLKDTDS